MGERLNLFECQKSACILLYLLISTLNIKRNATTDDIIMISFYLDEIARYLQNNMPNDFLEAFKKFCKIGHKYIVLTLCMNADQLFKNYNSIGCERSVDFNVNTYNNLINLALDYKFEQFIKEWNRLYTLNNCTAIMERLLEGEEQRQ